MSSKVMNVSKIVKTQNVKVFNLPVVSKIASHKSRLFVHFFAVYEQLRREIA